jgi:hypothetical protein
MARKWLEELWQDDNGAISTYQLPEGSAGLGARDFERAEKERNRLTEKKQKSRALKQTTMNGRAVQPSE